MRGELLTPYVLKETMQDYARLKAPHLFSANVNNYYRFCNDEQITIETSEDFARLVKRYHFLFNVTLVFTCTPKTKDLELWGAANLTIVDFRENKSERLPLNIHYYYYGYAISNKNVRYISGKAHNSELTAVGDYTCVNIDEALEHLELYKYQTDDSELKFKYLDKVYKFARHTFVAGVELEVPMFYDDYEAPKELKKHWLFSTDKSQLCGDLEVASKPSSLSYIASKRFYNRIQKLYGSISVPSAISKYVDHNGDEDGSGIHIHISWHSLDSKLVSADRVRKHYYSLCEAKGGKSFLLGVGGKSLAQFDYYSPWLPNLSINEEKYDCVNCVDQTHVELRWLANSPDPEVVHNRIREAVDIFKEAVVQSIREQIESTSKIFICRTIPQTLLKTRLQQQPTTAQAQAQASAS
jgi:hypothetical protein